MNRQPLLPIASLVLLAVLVSPVRPACAFPGMGFSPRVPVSAFGMPSAGLDLSQLHVTTTMSMGTGWGSQRMDALQVTSLSYRFRQPVWMSVSVGNAWGSGLPGATNAQSSMFLEGFSLAYRPSPNFQFQVQYKDIRSPLQLNEGPFGYWPR